jgi:hypothetical protein
MGEQIKPSIRKQLEATRSLPVGIVANITIS